MKSDKTVLKGLGDRITRVRLNLNLAQDELAEQSGVSLRTIQRIEKGEENYNILSLIAVARVLNVLDQIEALFPLVVNPLDSKQTKPNIFINYNGKDKNAGMLELTRKVAKQRVSRKDRAHPIAHSSKGPIRWGEDEV